METRRPIVFPFPDPCRDGVAINLIDLGDCIDRHPLGTEYQTMGARSGARGCIMGHRVLEEVTLRVYQRMHISHDGNLILWRRIINERLDTVV